jgi:hypothetical protein
MNAPLWIVLSFFAIATQTLALAEDDTINKLRIQTIEMELRAQVSLDGLAQRAPAFRPAEVKALRVLILNRIGELTQ